MTAYFAPPPQNGDLAQIRSYLFRMSEQLNAALTSLDSAAPASSAPLSSASAPALSQQAQTLRALIVKSAETVQSQLDAMNAHLSSSYLALSDWGEYQRNLSQDIAATAQETLASFGYEESIAALEENMASFETYRVSTGQYIKTGLLYYDGDGAPRYGVAVGEKLTTIEVDGQNVLTRSDLCATFTADRLTFWQGGAEVAHVSNSQLFITSANITQRLLVGDWEIARDSGLTIKFIGI